MALYRASGSQNPIGAWYESPDPYEIKNVTWDYNTDYAPASHNNKSTLYQFEAHNVSTIVWSGTISNDAGGMRIWDTDTNSYFYTFSSGTKTDESVDLTGHKNIKFDFYSTLNYLSTLGTLSSIKFYA